MTKIFNQTNKKEDFKSWYKQGEHWIWINASAVAICIIMVVGLLGVIMTKGFVYFWPKQVLEIIIDNNGKIEHYLGEKVDNKTITYKNHENETINEEQVLYKIGNRQEYSLDFKWFKVNNIKQITIPTWALVIERLEWGNAYGRFVSLSWQGKQHSDPSHLSKAIEQSQKLYQLIQTIEKKEIGVINHQIEKIRQQRKKMLSKELEAIELQDQLNQLANQKKSHLRNYKKIKVNLDLLYKKLNKLGHLTIRLANNNKKNIPLSQIMRVYYSNQLTLNEKVTHYFEKIWEFVSEDPREANTEGGIFPAIFGTVVLVLLMTVFVSPLGIITAIYLKEFAKQGFVVRLVRISVNNLAGVPSIVYGVFGLGFFVYFLGGSIDELFYSYNSPSPTFGSPNMLWAALTLALLTLPVVIVSTEEALNRVPISIHEGSLALGATKIETLWRIILPIISPGIMTGIILAIARAAGEVAPLMLVGVVKLAPDLVIDSTSPFIHLDRQFMHLGFHIFDVGFQSPNIEAAQPLVYATATLLIIIILLLNISAIKIRNRLRERYKSIES